MLITTITETLRTSETSETAQTWYTDAIYSAILWVPYVSTLSVLDGLVSRDNNELRTTVYRKPTHVNVNVNTMFTLGL